MTPGEIRLVWFPFSRAEVKPWKKRPVLILGSTGAPPDRAVLVVMITGKASRVGHPGPGDVVLADWKQCGLSTPSVIRTRRLWTAEDRDFEGTVLGKVNDQVLSEVLKAVRRLIK